jgi:hypothetical protein
MKGILVGHRSVAIALAEGLHDWGSQAVPLFNYTLTFALQLRKNTENFSQSIRVAKTRHIAPT